MRQWIGLGLLMMVLGTGCTTFRRAPFEAPAGFAQDPRAARLAEPRTRAAAWAELTPPPPKLHFSADLTARGSWWRGSERFGIFYFSFRPGQGAPALRLRGFQRQVGQTLFDLIVREGKMTAVLPGPALAFQGRLPRTGSPFVRRYGVEPWQLDDVLLIGRTLATGRFTQLDAGRGPLAVQAGEGATSTTPRVIELDRATGLPRRAEWEAGGQRYEVRYLAWDWFADKPPADPHAPAPAPPAADGPRTLMPSELELRRANPKTTVRLSVQHYQFGPLVPPRVFELVYDTPLKFEPLGKLEELMNAD